MPTNIRAPHKHRNLPLDPLRGTTDASGKIELIFIVGRGCTGAAPQGGGPTFKTALYMPGFRIKATRSNPMGLVRSIVCGAADDDSKREIGFKGFPDRLICLLYPANDGSMFPF